MIDREKQVNFNRSWSNDSIEVAAAEAAACRACDAALPLGPRPVFRVSASARVLLISQAPGTKAHNSGVPWDDASGRRLRSWLAMEPAAFYDVSKIAIVPMGLCYPGRIPHGGDALPRPECAPLWLHRFLRLMPDIRLTLLIGSYAQTHRLGKGGMTGRVRELQALEAGVIALPHPSWRTAGWEKRNPWFAADVLPVLRRAVTKALA